MSPSTQSYPGTKRVRYAHGTKGCELCERRVSSEGKYSARDRVPLESIISEHKRQLMAMQNALQTANATIRQLRNDNTKLYRMQLESEKKIRQQRLEKAELSSKVEQHWEDYEDDTELLPDLKEKISKRIPCIFSDQPRALQKARTKIRPEVLAEALDLSKMAWEGPGSEISNLGSVTVKRWTPNLMATLKSGITSDTSKLQIVWNFLDTMNVKVHIEPILYLDLLLIFMDKPETFNTTVLVLGFKYLKFRPTHRNLKLELDLTGFV
ncbi:hypothetical protein K3495_g12948 [Podosphaera aphanis]|nr:hypothetical protein K3495_g12948 [Podosphaera aphanis]